MSSAYHLFIENSHHGWNNGDVFFIQSAHLHSWVARCIVWMCNIYINFPFMPLGCNISMWFVGVWRLGLKLLMLFKTEILFFSKPFPLFYIFPIPWAVMMGGSLILFSLTPRCAIVIVHFITQPRPICGIETYIICSCDSDIIKLNVKKFVLGSVI